MSWELSTSLQSRCGQKAVSSPSICSSSWNSPHAASTLLTCSPNPHELWMKQITRNLTDGVDGFLNGKRYLLIDRDGKFCPAFHAMLKDSGVEPVLLPPKSPNLNSHIDRFHRSLKAEVLNRMIFFGEQSLRKDVSSFLEHFHSERNHQGLNT